MARQASQYQASGAVSDRFIGIVNQLAERIDVASGYRLGRYLDRYAETAPSKAFATNSFGIEYALKSSTHIPLSVTIKEVAVFTIEEARERLQAFLDGSFVPESLHDLIEYLGDKFLRIETHSHKDGGAVNYLVDTRSGASVPAHQVDPRLSHATMLQTRLRDVMRQQFGAVSPGQAFQSWQGMMFATDDDTNGIGYTVSGKDAWYGRIHAIATTDPEKNREMLRKAEAAGIQLVIPHKPGDPVDSMVAGMPILRRIQSAKAADLNPSLAHEHLSYAFGKSMFTAYEEMSERLESRNAKEAAAAVSVSVADFQSRFLRTEPEEPVIASSGLEDDFDGFGAFDAQETRDIVIRRENASELRLFVFDRDDDERIDIEPSSLLAGEYVRETEYGIQEGYTVVNEQGRMVHLDLSRERINLAVLTRDAARDMQDDPDVTQPGRRLH
ncbi:hypothetical protein G6L37_03080 [Agrobacterium rubi]|nr:hypothetical protein [Agrobacterium rubi]NTF24359.1 hypothetical protein [Agrobacterium rubi]